MKRIWVIEWRVNSSTPWNLSKRAPTLDQESADFTAKWLNDAGRLEYRAVPYVREPVSEEPRG